MDEPASDLELLRRFAGRREEAAFEELVARYANLVFGVALRKGVGREGAEDVAQKVFAVLARKAGKLGRRGSLAGWLSRTASLEAACMRRSDSNRLRKMHNYQDSGLAPASGAPTDRDPGAEMMREALPMLDDAIAELPGGDREVLLQRFYNERSFAAIAAIMNKTEAAVQKQARRALDKLSKLLSRRGVVIPAAALSGGLGAALAGSAPATTISALSQGALTAAPAIAGSSLITNTVQTMAYAKTKTAIAVAALAAIPTGLQWARINELERELETRPEVAAVAPPSDAGAEELAALQAEVAQLQSQLVAARRMRPGAVSALARRPKNPGGFAAIADLFEDPEMADLMKSQLKSQVMMMFGDFIEHAGLDEAGRARFEEILVDRQMVMARKGMKVMSATASDEDKRVAREEMAAAGEQSNAAIKDLLGEELFAEFQRFEDSSTERTELMTFKSALARKGVDALSFAQEERLMGIMYDERKAFDFSNDFNLDPNAVPEWQMTQSSVQQIAADFETLHGQIARRAGEVLNPEQVEIFLANQESQRKMMRAGLEMSVKMLGSNGESGE